MIKMLLCYLAGKLSKETTLPSELSKQVVGYANGLPLVLEVIGSFLHKSGLREWKSAINRMNDMIKIGKFRELNWLINFSIIYFDNLNNTTVNIYIHRIGH